MRLDKTPNYIVWKSEYALKIYIFKVLEKYLPSKRVARSAIKLWLSLI